MLSPEVHASPTGVPRPHL